MMTNSVLTIKQQLNSLLRQHRQIDAERFQLEMASRILDDEIAIMQVRYCDALQLHRLREQGAAAVAEAERVIGGRE